MSEFYRDSGNGSTEALTSDGATSAWQVLDAGKATILTDGDWNGTLKLQQRVAANDGGSVYDADGGSATYTASGGDRKLAWTIEVPHGFAWRLHFTRTGGTANVRIVQ